MESRWFNSVIVLFWLSTMTWLVTAKVVPALRRGEPPNYRSIYTESPNELPPVAWEMTLSGKSLGWALNRVSHTVSNVTEVRGRIHFEHIPLEELSPAWMQYLIRSSQAVETLKMDVDNLLTINGLGHLTSFRSSLRIPGFRNAITIKGETAANRLKVTVESGDLLYESDPIYLPSDALLSDELSPHSRLVGLRVGQQWTAPVFSPLRPPNDPIEILHARVEDNCPILSGDETVRTFLVVYRADAGSTLSSNHQPRAKLWVSEDGSVLRQETYVLGKPLVFTRVSDSRALELDNQVKKEEAFRGRYRSWFVPATVGGIVIQAGDNARRLYRRQRSDRPTEASVDFAAPSQ